MKRGEKGFTDLTHRESAIQHAIKRMWQRRGLLLARPDYDALCALVRSGAIKKACDADKGCVAYPLVHRGQNVIAIWSPEQDCIVTFYPTLAWLEQRKAVPA